MKLWDKGYTVDNIVERYTVGNDRELDMHLAKYDVQGSLAHARMLHHIGILAADELTALEQGLAHIAETVDAGTFVIEPHFEDVHSKVEAELVRLIGDAGKKIHTARSRNDQVLVDLHLYAKAELSEVIVLVDALFERLLALAEQHKEVLMPGYTHTQVAMPSSFGLWFSAYAEMLVDDVIMLKAALRIADQNPLGSGAGFGSSFPIDRTMTTELLGFSTMRFNVVAAQMSRGRLERTVAAALAAVANTLGRLSADICLYMSQNFGFIGFPKELTTGSSIMPHKQNPDVFEVMRAKCNHLQQLPMAFTLMTANLTSGYHRDFQLLKQGLIEGIETTKDNLRVCEFMLQHITVGTDILDNPIYDQMYSVEDVNRLVMGGMTFRDAYRKLGEEIIAGSYTPSKTVDHTHEGSIGNLCLQDIRTKMRQA
ncbi:MAG: argininosuccinate lyase [Flavobacteriales bacterium]|nr:argininosuccinate lyase [Flavobacteriales bacterium]